MPDLSIRNLHATIDGAEILRGIDLDVDRGSVHAIMGPNGSGKSTLAHVLMGHPAYEVTEGSVTFRGTDVLELEPDERVAARHLPRVPVSERDPGRDRRELPAHGRERAPARADGEENPIRIPEFRKLLQENMEC